MNNNFTLTQQVKASPTRYLLNRMNSTSYLNNGAVDYRFNKVKLCKISTQIRPNIKSRKTSVIERDSNSRGLNKDNDTKYSQEILQIIKRKRIVFKDKLYDINSLLLGNPVDIKISSPRDKKFATYERTPNFHKEHLLSLNRKVLAKRNGANSYFKKPLNSYDGVNNELNNKVNEFRYKSISVNPSYRNTNYACGEERDCGSINSNNKRNHISKESKSLNIDSTNNSSNTRILIRKIVQKEMILNENCSKMKNNLMKQKSTKSTLKLNKNYQMAHYKDGVQLFLDSYLVPKANEEQVNNFNGSISEKRSDNNFLLIQNNHNNKSNPNTRNSTKRISISSNFFHSSKNLNVPIPKKQLSQRNYEIYEDDYLFQFISNDLIKSMLESKNFRKIKNANQNSCSFKERNQHYKLKDDIKIKTKTVYGQDFRKLNLLK